MSYDIKFDRKALKELKAIHKTDAVRIIDKIETELVLKPGADKKLKGDKSSFYSYRIGSYRVIYELVETTIIIVKISHRKDVYI